MRHTPGRIYIIGEELIHAFEQVRSRLDLTNEQKLLLFEFATQFQISENITLEQRVSRKGKNKWAIAGPSGYCYCKDEDKWEYEPLPSNRSDDFLAKTRYSLPTALEILNSPDFSEKYLGGKPLFPFLKS